MPVISSSPRATPIAWHGPQSWTRSSRCRTHSATATSCPTIMRVASERIFGPAERARRQSILRGKDVGRLVAAGAIARQRGLKSSTVGSTTRTGASLGARRVSVQAGFVQARFVQARFVQAGLGAARNGIAITEWSEFLAKKSRFYLA